HNSCNDGAHAAKRKEKAHCKKSRPRQGSAAFLCKQNRLFRLPALISAAGSGLRSAAKSVRSSRSALPAPVSARVSEIPRTRSPLLRASGDSADILPQVKDRVID